MNRNAESRFAQNPTNIDISRSRFDRTNEVTTSFDAGLLIPFFVDEVLPGDTFKIKCSKVVRMPALITPVMGNIYLDTFWFFVPNRLVWSHWKEFMGENTQSAWIPQATYSIPQLTSPTSGGSLTSYMVGTTADYFGIPTGVTGINVSALPFRGYALIWNEFFRDENLQDPIPFSTGDANVTGFNGMSGNETPSQLLQAYYRGGRPAPVAKFHDYFTSALPAPQKGNDVTINVVNGGLLPVFAYDNDTPFSSLPQSTVPVRFYNQAGSGPYNMGTGAGTTPDYDQTYYTAPNFYKDSSTVPVNPSKWLPSNLFATSTGNLPVATVNQLRTAFQLQKLLEKDARGGSRYIEQLKAHFSVTSPDYRLQRPEYLGGSRIPIRVSQVVQQSETASTPQGNVAGMSLTTDSDDGFTKSFTEHGYVFGLLCARYIHSYQQGLARFWSRKTRFEFYFPVLANIGEQPILNKEIFVQGSTVVDSDGNPYDDQVFAYQEAWADYRYKPNLITGQMRSTYSASLDSWHLGDYYSQLPTLSADWIKEDKSVLDRCLSVTSAVSNQFIANIYIHNICVRAMPLYSIPGLIDHH